MMHISELTQGPHILKAKDIDVVKKVLLLLHSSKTHDAGSAPQQIKIIANKAEKTGSYLNRHFCPFAVMRQYIAVWGPYVDGGEPFCVFRGRQPITVVNVATLLGGLILSIGLNSEYYGSHSLRIGRSTDLIKYGYSVEAMRRLGRWKSSAVYLYIRCCE